MQAVLCLASMANLSALTAVIKSIGLSLPNARRAAKGRITKQTSPKRRQQAQLGGDSRLGSPESGLRLLMISDSVQHLLEGPIDMITAVSSTKPRGGHHAHLETSLQATHFWERIRAARRARSFGLTATIINEALSLPDLEIGRAHV